MRTLILTHPGLAARWGRWPWRRARDTVLIARTNAWLGRGVRTPGRKPLRAGGVSPDAFGRAFGFERRMDTLGAIVAPVTALWLTGFWSGLWRLAFWRR